jgi:hypothetical protein
MPTSFPSMQSGNLSSIDPLYGSMMPDGLKIIHIDLYQFSNNLRNLSFQGIYLREI